MRRVLVVRCHPLRDCYVDAMYGRVLVALEGHDVRTLDLYAAGFAPELEPADLDPAMGALQAVRDRANPPARTANHDEPASRGREQPRPPMETDPGQEPSRPSEHTDRHDGHDIETGSQESSPPWEHTGDPESSETVIARHVADLAWCDLLVLVYPTWWAGQPAMLKGWIDRVWGPTLQRGRRFSGIRRIVAVTSHGSSKWVNILEGEGGKRTLSRNLAPACGLGTRTSWIALYGIDRRSGRERQAFLDRVERRVRRLV